MSHDAPQTTCSIRRHACDLQHALTGAVVLQHVDLARPPQLSVASGRHPTLVFGHHLNGLGPGPVCGKRASERQSRAPSYHVRRGRRAACQGLLTCSVCSTPSQSVSLSQTVCHEHCDACAGAARLPAVGHAAGVLQRLPRPTKGFFCAGSHAGAQMLNPKVSLAGLENTRGAEACLSFWKACTWQCKALAEFFQVTIVALTTI